MYKGKKITAMIPARGGSKGLPGKNIKTLLGKPLIAWTIEAGLESACIDYLFVNTDDPEIAEVSKRFGADIPFMRPAGLATDDSLVMDVIFDAQERLKSAGRDFDIIVLLQPTSPARTAKDIDEAIKLLFEKDGRAVVSVCQSEHHPYWSNTISPDLSMRNFIRPEATGRNRQALPDYYRLNGCIYIAYFDFLISNRSFIGEGTYAYIMPIERSSDIDDIYDFRCAEILMSSN